MPPVIGCFAGAALYRMREMGWMHGHSIGARRTPFGQSEEIFLVEQDDASFFLVPLTGADRFRLSPSFVNYRANLYALKDLGVQGVLGFTAAGAITHNYEVGDIVLVTDLIDQTRHRPCTFFENSGVGVLRQFPVFCPSLLGAMSDCLSRMGVRYHASSTLVVTEGPRLETPAEIRRLASSGEELVSHQFAPEAFLAKELELCYAGVAYVANFAETGSQFRPFSAHGLFAGTEAPSDDELLAEAIETIARLVGRVERYLSANDHSCECGSTMREQAAKFGLPEDWRQWFAATGGKRAVGTYEKAVRRSIQEGSTRQEFTSA